ncbi:MAG: hypothetical protein ACRELV_12210, partial [Longimicrobiales bacterium]
MKRLPGGGGGERRKAEETPSSGAEQSGGFGLGAQSLVRLAAARADGGALPPQPPPQPGPKGLEPGRAYGFFTDTTLCIGCKACE